MKIFSAFKIIFSQYKITATVWAIQFLLALTLGMQVINVLQSSIGNSLEISKLLHGYDHTVISDFLKIHGTSLTPLIGQLRWLALVYLVFAVFLDAGLLYCAIRPKEANWQTFWQSGATYFLSFLKIAAFFMLLLLLWSALLLLPIMMYGQPSIEWFPSEKYTVWGIYGLVAIWLLGLPILFIWSVRSRIQHIETGSGFWQSIKSGLRTFWQKKWTMLRALSILAGIQFVILLFYYWLQSISGMTSASLILVFFLIQQVFVYFRILIRQVAYAVSN